MRLKLTQQDAGGTTFLRPGALPLVVAAIVVPVLALLLGGLLVAGSSGLGLAAGALAIATLIVVAVRAKQKGTLEVAEHTDAGHRVLVMTREEIGPDAAQRISERAGDVDDVRLMVPLSSRTIDRWLSAEDPARRDAEGLLARSAATLVAAGLPVSGSIGDSDAATALEDELRSFPADELIVLTAGDTEDPLLAATRRADLPLTQLSPS